MKNFKTLFANTKPIIGMIHLRPLPGSPLFDGNLKAIYEQALSDAEKLQAGGIDAVIIENFGDEPYRIGNPNHEQLAVMSAVTQSVKDIMTVPTGVNIQFNAWEAEIALAYALNLDFIRLEVFVDTVLSAQGPVSPCSAEAGRKRADLNAEVLFFADIQTKYTDTILNKSLLQSAKEAVAAHADALIVTGKSTGSAAVLGELQEVSQAVTIPVLSGSGTTINNLQEIFNRADGAIVGSALKENGLASNPVSQENVKAFMHKAKNIRMV